MTIVDRMRLHRSIYALYHHDSIGRRMRGAPIGRRMRGAPSFVEWLRAHPERVHESADRELERDAAHLSRDYREWRPDWDWSMPIMVGSGRRADWCHQSYRWYSHLCETIHRELGWSGERVRETARALSSIHHGVRGAVIPHPLPARALVHAVLGARGVRGEPGVDDVTLGWEATYVREGVDEQTASVRTHWSLWMRHVFAPSWGRLELARTAYRLEHDPRYITPSMAAGLIRHLRGEDTTDFRGCSGCEWLSALTDRPDLHDWMMSRSAPAVRGKLGPLDAMLVQFGQAYPAEYDHGLVLGLSYEIRVRSADYERIQRAEKSRPSAWQFEAAP